jgi:hypothetical protein
LNTSKSISNPNNTWLTQPSTPLAKRRAAFPERKLQIIPSEQRILAIGSEQQHFEVSKLLTLLLEKE